MTRNCEVIPLPGEMREFSTAAGQIQIIGGENKFAVRRPGALANVADITYFGAQTLTLHQAQGDIIIRPFQTEEFEASPILDPLV